jgi:hypothetical protein
LFTTKYDFNNFDFDDPVYYYTGFLNEKKFIIKQLIEETPEDYDDVSSPLYISSGFAGGSHKKKYLKYKKKYLELKNKY